MFCESVVAACYGGCRFMVQRGSWLRILLPRVGCLRLAVEHGMLGSKLFVEVSGNGPGKAEVTVDFLQVLAVGCLDFLYDVFPLLATRLMLPVAVAVAVTLWCQRGLDLPLRHLP